MYQLYYNLTEKPFKISPDPKFLWLGQKHRAALDFLKYGILNNLGFFVLTGDIGTGKTTLINALIEDLDDDIVVARISDPKMNTLEFFDSLVRCFNWSEIVLDKSDFVTIFTKCLYQLNTNEKSALLIIDEAQHISDDLLEEIRLLSNIEKPNVKFLNILLVGQSDFNHILIKSKNKALRQRIVISHHIHPLTKNETGEYIRYRLKIAGTKREIFSRRAIDAIYSFSMGYPRLINIVCDQSLLAGYANDLKKITREVINECAREFRLPSEAGRSKLSKAGRIFTKEVLPLSRKVVYLSLILLVIVFSGSFLAANRYDDYSARVGKYYGQLYQKCEDNLEEQNPLQTELLEPGPVSTSKNTPQQLQEDQQPFSLESMKLVIPFRFNTNEISRGEYSSLDKLVANMLRNPNTRIVVKGYTDASGSYSYNKKLSEFRANIVKSYLVGKGISFERIMVIGMGAENPIKLNTTPKGRRANRRVEIELAPSTKQ